MRDVALNQLDAWSMPGERRASQNAAASIAELWQFWLDVEMDLTIILPPDGCNFADFPCGRNAIGRNLFDLLSVEINPTAAVAFHNAFRAQDKIRNARFTRGADDGRDLVMLISGVPTFDRDGVFEGYRCTVSDISSAVSSGPIEASDYAAMLAAFIRHVPNMVVMKDIEGRFMAVNPLAERTYGMPLGKLAGKHARDILPPELADQCCKEDDAVLEGEQVRETEQTFPASDGARVFHTVKFPIFDADRYLVGTGAIGMDITVQTMLLRALNRDLPQAD